MEFGARLGLPCHSRVHGTAVSPQAGRGLRQGHAPPVASHKVGNAKTQLRPRRGRLSWWGRGGETTARSKRAQGAVFRPELAIRHPHLPSTARCSASLQIHHSMPRLTPKPKRRIAICQQWPAHAGHCYMGEFCRGGTADPAKVGIGLYALTEAVRIWDSGLGS